MNNINVTRRSTIILGHYKIRVRDSGFNLWTWEIYHRSSGWELAKHGKCTYDRFTGALLVAIHHLNKERA